MWSVEREPQEYKSVDEIVDDSLIVRTLEETKEAAKDVGRVREILQAAKERSLLKNAEPGGVFVCFDALSLPLRELIVRGSTLLFYVPVQDLLSMFKASRIKNAQPCSTLTLGMIA